MAKANAEADMLTPSTRSAAIQPEVPDTNPPIEPSQATRAAVYQTHRELVRYLSHFKALQTYLRELRER